MRLAILPCLLAAMLAACTAVSFGQATRTWVSGVGDDANPCSRTAPCKTFAGAISKTAAGGEISVLDPGGYGSVTITKGMTIDGAGTNGSILASGGVGVVVSASENDTVILRNLNIQGAGTGSNGIRFTSGRALVIENCTICNFTGNGIWVTRSGTGNLVIHDTTIRNCATGIKTYTSAGSLLCSFSNLQINNCVTGILADNGSKVGIRDSDLSVNATGILAQTSALLCRVNVDSCMVTNCNVAMQSGPGQPAIRLTDCTLANNTTALASSGGNFTSAGNNAFLGNASDGAPTIIVPLR